MYSNPTSSTLERSFHNFFAGRGHRRIDGHPLQSPTPDVLFTTSGMHQLVPHLTGEPHPSGQRLTSTQRCLRTVDIGDVGDDTHLTVFDMLGSWSLGSYGVTESLTWTWQFLTEIVGLDPQLLYVTIHGGHREPDGHEVPADRVSPGVWEELFTTAGVPFNDRFYTGDRHTNWWSSGPTGLCGPDTELFVWTGNRTPDRPFHPDDRGWVEVWNTVLMTFSRGDDGRLEPLTQHNIDTGMGLERLTMIANRSPSVWDTPEMRAMVEDVRSVTGRSERESRIIVDHVRSGLCGIGEGILPGENKAGYVIRRIVRKGTLLLPETRQRDVVELVRQHMSTRWTPLQNPDTTDVFCNEMDRYRKTLQRCDRLVRRFAGKTVTGETIRWLHHTHGIPPEVSMPALKERGHDVDRIDVHPH